MDAIRKNTKERPIVPIEMRPEAHLSEELFQNEVLRPIVKMQHDLMLAVFQLHISRFEKDWEAVSIQKKKAVVRNQLLKNAILKNIVVGMTIGQFTPEEMTRYSENPKNYDKRIVQMVTERLLSTL